MEEHRVVTLKLIGFNKKEQNSFSAVLTLASRALKKKWQVVERENADFFLLSQSCLEAGNQDEILKDLPSERRLLCIPASATQTERSLLVDNSHMPRLSSLVALFNQVTASSTPTVEAEMPVQATPPVKSPISCTEIVNEPFFDPQQGLLGHLLTTNEKQFIISLNNQPDYAPIYINVEKNAYYSRNNAEQLSVYLTDSEALTIQSCSEIEMENSIKTESLKPTSLKDLIWYISIKTSAGKVIKGHLATDIVTLKGWPDLRLFKFLEYAKVATFMKHNAAPLEIIAEQTKASLESIYNFYNACYLIGLIEKRAQIEINKKNITPELSDLLTKINARLK